MSVTGEAYVARIDAVESNRRARAAFHDLVLRNAAPGASIFDFGAGPGTDALFYAQSGFAVTAYDHDPEMCAALRIRCHQHMAQRVIRLLEGSFEEFLCTPSPFAGSIDVVTSNFAPLSMVDDLGALFGKFAELTRPGGKIVVSVLNPYSLHDLRYGWWWRHQARFWREGQFSIAGPTYRIHRRSVANLSAQAAPHFRLVQVQSGLPTTAPWRLPVLRQLALVRSGFMFLVFERSQPLSSAMKSTGPSAV
jgi:SAM-dependent methyltransferase